VNRTEGAHYGTTIKLQLVHHIICPEPSTYVQSLSIEKRKTSQDYQLLGSA